MINKKYLMTEFETDCTRTVTFFKIPVYNIKAYFSAAKNITSALEMAKESAAWSLVITPIRRVNIAHLTNSLVQKLIQVSPDETSHLPQIMKFNSLLPPKMTLDSSRTIKLECTNKELRIHSRDVQSNQESLIGNMDGVVICDLLAKVYFDAAYRGLPCPDLLNNIKTVNN